MLPLPYQSAEMATDHHRTLLDEAAARRRLRSARVGDAHRPVSTVGPRTAPGGRLWLTALKQAAAVQIRPIRAADALLLRDGFARLGPDSRRSRFLGAKNVLTTAEVRYLTEVDHHDHEALVALNRVDGNGVGVARYIRDRDDVHSAEVAVTVVDDWQLRGIGTRLMVRLRRRALAEGITRFTALVLEENFGARRLMQHIPGSTTLVARDADRLSYVVELAGPRFA